ncbi:transporter substrate-binding domain-containing protein [Christensenella sp.]|uniref:transporter substrate-binding domain-containing protein n=1 Tax=Christensenella sp. TaxID=1935934 RepID=UPI002B214EE0|nr:transporter substrate-binding domain-containing protein [Christensenella sp.]
MDYLNKIAQITHWNYEFVKVSNGVEATSLLESSGIDLLAPAQKTEALSAAFDYSVYSMGTEFAAIYTLSTREDLLYEDFTTIATLKYGGTQNSTFTTKFLEDYCVSAGFTPNLTLYDNTTELFNALHSGTVDVVVTNIMFADDDVKLLGRFHPMPVYYITQKGNTALLDELNEAMIDIRMDNPTFETDLMNQYFPMYSNTQFTYAETQFIKNIGEITIGYEVNHAPLSYTDQSTGEFAGVTRDVLDRISEITGMTFKYAALPATDVTYDYLRENQIYVLSNVEYNSLNTANPAYNGLSVLPIQSLDDQLCISTIAFQGDSSDTAQQLSSGTFISIVDKAIKQMSTLEVDTIIMENTAASQYRTTFLDFVYPYRYPLLCLGLLLGACLALLIRSRKIEKISIFCSRM